MLFQDRRDAGKRLATKLTRYARRSDVLVLALPRGGVPVGFEVAQALSVPLDVFLVRMLGFPDQKGLVMGAIASGGIRILNQGLLKRMHVSEEILDEVARREELELQARERIYRGERPTAAVRGRTVLLVDDGLTTGTSMRAAAAALRAKGPARLVAALPVAAPDACEEFEDMVEEIVGAATPDPLLAAGDWYRQFGPTSDEEIATLLAQARGRPAAPRGSDGAAIRDPRSSDAS